MSRTIENLEDFLLNIFSDEYNEENMSFEDLLNNTNFPNYIKSSLINVNNGSCNLLDISYSDIGINEAKAIASAIRSNANLTFVGVHTLYISPDILTKITDALQTHQNVEFIDFSYNNLDDDCLDELAKILTVNNKIKKLNLSNNQISNDGMLSLSYALKDNEVLELLNLDNNNIGGEYSCYSFGDILSQNRSLKSISLSGNRIGDKEVVELSKLIVSNPVLENLYLSKNGIGNIGANAIAKALKSNSFLKKLILYENMIDSEGAIPLADSVLECKNLRELVLSNNDIGPEGGLAFANMIRNNQTLEVLGLSNCNFGIGILEEIGRSLSKNYSITTIFAKEYDAENNSHDINIEFEPYITRNKKIFDTVIRSSFEVAELCNIFVPFFDPEIEDSYSDFLDIIKAASTGMFYAKTECSQSQDFTEHFNTKILNIEVLINGRIPDWIITKIREDGMITGSEHFIDANFEHLSHEGGEAIGDMQADILPNWYGPPILTEEESDTQLIGSNESDI